MRRVVVLTLLVACQPVNSPVMEPGEDCASCHEQGDNPRRWTVAGTVFSSLEADQGEGQEGAAVFVTDATGRELTLVSNSAGNFYTAETLTFPLSVEVQLHNRRFAMQAPVEAGSCNACHKPGGENGAPGRMFIE